MAPFEGKTGFEKGLMELVAFGNGEGDCCSGIGLAPLQIVHHCAQKVRFGGRSTWGLKWQ